MSRLRHLLPRTEPQRPAGHYPQQRAHRPSAGRTSRCAVPSKCLWQTGPLCRSRAESSCTQEATQTHHAHELGSRLAQNNHLSAALGLLLPGSQRREVVGRALLHPLTIKTLLTGLRPPLSCSWPAPVRGKRWPEHCASGKAVGAFLAAWGNEGGEGGLWVGSGTTAGIGLQPRVQHR